MIELYEWQREAIDALERGSGGVLVVAPTGGGKSMCYQEPAARLPGVALVITPLVALMADQVASLQARGIAAAYLASNVDPAENRAREEAALRGDLKLLYVAPERLASERFVEQVLARLPLSLVAVDEAHCISQWGHDFRPDYLQIGALVQRLQPKRLLACTATATPDVRREILARLSMPDAHQVLRGFARRNLQLSAEEVSGTRAKSQRIIAELRRVLGKPGSGAGTAIVYTSQRRHAEDVASELRAAGWRAAHYHAGMDGDDRTSVQSQFQSGTLDVVAATNAFGMGIDRADIRLVLHHAIPESVEAYYQEVGRAGRDGEPATGLLLVSDPDITWRFGLIAREQLSSELALRRREMLRSMIDYGETAGCRHDALLRYFEDDAEALGGCGHCDNCLAGAQALEAGAEESSAVVRAVLRALRALPFALGAGSVASYLVGHRTKNIERHELHTRDGFGVLRERTEEWTRALLRRLLASSMVAVDPEHGTLRMSRRGAEVESGRLANPVLLPPARGRVTARPSRSSKTASPRDDEMDGHALALLAKLKEWRSALAARDAVPAYVILPDATLRGIAAMRPADDDGLLALDGMGPVKLERYRADLLRIVGEYVREHAPPPPDARAARAAESRPSSHDERLSEARREFPRAFLRWEQEEDERLRALAAAGMLADQIAAELQRQPNAVRIRAERLEISLPEPVA